MILVLKLGENFEVIIRLALRLHFQTHAKACYIWVSELLIIRTAYVTVICVSSFRYTDVWFKFFQLNK